ncbi:unnamed protein product [Protopolystoma xenopodis]|uniref:Uncharacterized protein n=1 Tax=Protopolystoma xenopodis TaxID=117903 RepID=A0A448XNN3_9PLAT|nr:unnamed protein product [Protopolystoma xenopodis]
MRELSRIQRSRLAQRWPETVHVFTGIERNCLGNSVSKNVPVKPIDSCSREAISLARFPETDLVVQHQSPSDNHGHLLSSSSKVTPSPATLPSVISSSSYAIRPSIVAGRASDECDPVPLYPSELDPCR